MVTCSNLKIKAYGKINLALDIVGKRDDGYHMLNTVMQSVSCFDLLDFTLSEGEGIELTCKLDSFPKGEDNIITKACHAFADPPCEYDPAIFCALPFSPAPPEP